MVALAGLYLLQGAEFIAAVQIIVYGGAIMVLFVFVIMLLNAGEEERITVFDFRVAGSVGVPLGVVFLVEAVLLDWASDLAHAAASVAVQFVDGAISHRLLFREYVFPFELTIRF